MDFGEQTVLALHDQHLNKSRRKPGPQSCGHKDFVVFPAVMLKEAGRYPSSLQRPLRTSCKGHCSMETLLFYFSNSHNVFVCFPACGGGDKSSLFSFSLSWNERAALACSESFLPAAV